jgi:hypothetical protein
MKNRIAGMLLMLAVASGPVSAQTRDYAYIALRDRDRVAVLDAVTRTLVANIPVVAAR